MTGFKLIAVLVIVGGAIAYFGDRIGMRVGRKRLTLWGLRPRHTSLIITVLTGIIIAAGSLGVLSLSSNNVRVALFHIQQIQDELKSRTADLGALNDKLAAEQAALQLAKEQLDEVKSDYEKTKNDKDVLQSRVTNLQEVESRLTDTVGDMTTTVDQLQTKIDALNQQLKSLQQQAQNGNWIFLKGRLWPPTP
ncbi:MAG TPA: DUF3084 domain-containing protein [Limnochordia bacterium]|nr:DUF3084 domain-containing protein [Limnochordia bacterium]